MKKTAYFQNKAGFVKDFGLLKNLRNYARMSLWAQISAFGSGEHF